MSAYTQGPGLVNHKVKVAVRLRPFIEREKQEGAKNNWVVEPTEIIHVDPETQLPKPHNNKQFVFDNVFGPEVTTRTVYDDIVAPIVNEAFNGFNGTVLCYGQTSSGKTHTLYGTEADPGIISFLADDIQKRIENVPGGKVVIRLNLIEIYNENVKDLLCSENPIELVERDGTVVPLKAEHIDIFSGSDIIQAAKRLQRERRLGETRMNSQSSRSHTILRMTINTFDEDEFNAMDNANQSATSQDEFETTTLPGKRIISAVLNFVDLAGSEKASQTGASGDRLREAGHINTSLSALSKVVSQLSKQYESGSKKESSSIASSMCNSIEPRAPRSRFPAGMFVSYRDSKLTRLLQSSLAGDALIAIITNATPASSEETLSTLRFALSAKEIQTKPKRNLITNKLDKLQYENTIKELQAELFGKNEELRLLRMALSKKNATKNEEFEQPPERRNTFHFRTGTGKDWKSLSMIEENEIQQRHSNAPITADDALREFRELSMISSVSEVPPPPAETEEQTNEQTNVIIEDDVIPSKRRKLDTDDTSTPISTLRLQRSLMNIAHSADIKDWSEEKEFLVAEMELIKTENQQLRNELDVFKKSIPTENKNEDISLPTNKVDPETASSSEENDSLQLKISELQNEVKTMGDRLNEKEAELKLREEDVSCLRKQHSEIILEKSAGESEILSLHSCKLNLEKQLHQLQSDYEIKSREYENLKGQNETDEFQQLKVQIDSKNQLISELQQDNEAFRNKLTKKEEEEEQLRKDMDTVNCQSSKRISALRNEITDHEQSMASLRSTKENLEQQLLQAQTQLEQQSREMETLKLKSEVTSVNNNSEEEINFLKISNSTLKDEVNRITNQLCEKEAELNAQSENISSLQHSLQEIDSLQSKISELQNEVMTMTDQLCEKEAELKLREEDVSTLRKQHSEIVLEKSAGESEFESLQNFKVDLELQLHQMKLDYEIQSSEYENLKVKEQNHLDEYQQLLTQIDSKTELISELQQDNETFRNKLTEKEEEEEQLRKDMDTANCQMREGLTALRSEITDHEKSIVSLRDTRDRLERQLVEAQTQVEAKTQEIETLKSDLQLVLSEATSGDNNSEEIESLKISNSELRDDIDRITKQLYEKETALRLQEEDLSSLRKQHSEIVLQKSADESEIESLQFCKVNLEKQLYQVQSDYETQSSEYETLKVKEQSQLNEYQQLLTQIDSKNQLISELQQDNETFKTKLIDEEQLKKDIDTASCQMREDLTALRNEITDNEQSITSLQNSNEKLEQQLAESQTQFESQSQEIETLKVELQRALSDARSVDNNSQEEIKSLRISNSELSDEINRITKQLNEKEVEIKAQSENVSSLQHSLTEINSLQSKISELQAAVKTTTDRLYEKEEELKLRENDVSSLRKQHSEIVLEKSASESALQSLQSCKSNLEKQLHQMQSDYEIQSSEYANLKEQLQQEVQSQDAELKVLRAKVNSSEQTVNIKYSEKLKQDLKASWKDNKDLEDKISELRQLLQGKEEELSQQIRKVQDLNLDDMKPRAEFDRISKEMESRKMELETMTKAKVEIEDQLALSKTKIHGLEQQLEKVANKRKPAITSRGIQTPDDWDPSVKVKELAQLKMTIKVINRELEQSKKQLASAESEKKSALVKLEKTIGEKEARINSLEDHIKGIIKDKDAAKLRQMDQGIQCEYITELVERSRKGENVKLPPEFPNVAKLNTEVKNLKNRVFNLESLLTWCKCEANAEKKKRLLSQKGDMSGSIPGKSPATTSKAIQNKPVENTPLFAPPRSVYTRGSAKVVGVPNLPPTKVMMVEDTIPVIRRSSRISKTEPNFTSPTESPVSPTRPVSVLTPLVSSCSPPAPKKKRSSDDQQISPPTVVTRSQANKLTPPPIPSSSSPKAQGNKIKPKPAMPSSITTRSLRSAPKSSIIVKGDEEFQQRSADFMQWLQDNSQ